MVNFVLTSTSDLKREAVESFLKENFSITNPKILCVSCIGCDLPQQPISCGAECAFRRIEFAKGKSMFDGNVIVSNAREWLAIDFDRGGMVGIDENDIFISIENDLSLEPVNMQYLNYTNVVPSYVDRAHVRVEFGSFVGKGVSMPIMCFADAIFPDFGKQELITFSEKITGYEKTGGQLLNKAYGIDDKNWMKTIAGIDRKTQIASALKNAFDDLVSNANKCLKLSNKYKIYPNFPIEGVDFKYFYSLFFGSGASVLSDLLESKYKEYEPDCILGIETRGLVLGTLLADRLKTTLIPIQKPGKIPGEKLEAEYEKEYGKDKIEVSIDLFKELFQQEKPVYRFLIVDDLVATGGSISAVIQILGKVCKDKKYTIETILVDEVAPLRSVAEKKIGSNNYVLFRDVESNHGLINGIYPGNQ